MKKTLTIAWNLLLLIFVALAASVILPKVLGQFEQFDKLSEGPFRTRTMMLGVQGLGLFVVIAAGALSLSSLFWRKVSWIWRCVFLGILAVCGIGTLIAIRTDRADMGFVSYGDYIAFLLGAIAITFPIVACGTGYPSLLVTTYRRMRGENLKSKKVAS